MKKIYQKYHILLYWFLTLNMKKRPFSLKHYPFRSEVITALHRFFYLLICYDILRKIAEWFPLVFYIVLNSELFSSVGWSQRLESKKSKPFHQNAWIWSQLANSTCYTNNCYATLTFIVTIFFFHFKIWNRFVQLLEKVLQII